MSTAYYPSTNVHSHQSLAWLYYTFALIFALVLAIFAAIYLDKNLEQGSPIFANRREPPAEANIVPIVEVNKPDIVGFDDEDILAINDVVKEWGAKQNGYYTITITDVNGYPILVDKGDESLYSASVYKLFVAYIGYQYLEDGRIDAGMANCLEQMIVVSSNYCGRLVRATIGTNNINSELRKYGINNTDMNTVTTSSSDMATVTKLIWNGVDLSHDSRAKLIDTMDKQRYTGAFQSGFKHAKVYDKIGCCGGNEYTDAAIIEFPDDRVLMISIMTEGIFSWNIHRLGEQIEKIFVN